MAQTLWQPTNKPDPLRQVAHRKSGMPTQTSPVAQYTPDPTTGWPIRPLWLAPCGPMGGRGAVKV